MGDSPSVILMAGLPASGKTTTAMRLHAAGGGVLIRSCDVYKTLGISLPDWVVRTAGFTINIAEYDCMREQAYREMARLLEKNLLAGAHLTFLDAVHGEAPKRQAVYEICRIHRATPVIVLCECGDWSTIKRRFTARRGRETDPEHEASDLAVFHDIRRRWQDPRQDRWTGAAAFPLPVVVYDTKTGILRVEGDLPQPLIALLDGLVPPASDLP